MPEVSWATELGLDITRLEMERPEDYFQKQLTVLNTRRGEAFADFTRFRSREQTFAAEIVAWEKYITVTRTVCDLIGAPIPVGIISREAERRRNIEDAVLKNTCTRCGFVWQRRQPKFVDGLCSSCLALQEKVLRRGRLACHPWQGRFARDEFTPVKATGEPILPGRRVCGNLDCVNPKHIRKERNKNG